MLAFEQFVVLNHLALPPALYVVALVMVLSLVSRIFTLTAYLSSSTIRRSINARRGGPQTLHLCPPHVFYAESCKRPTENTPPTQTGE